MNVGLLAPPETDRKADVNGPDVVPASWRDVEHVSWVKEVFLTYCLGEVGKPGEVRRLHVYLRGGERK